MGNGLIFGPDDLRLMMDLCREEGLDPIPWIIEELENLGYVVLRRDDEPA